MPRILSYRCYIKSVMVETAEQLLALLLGKALPQGDFLRQYRNLPPAEQDRVAVLLNAPPGRTDPSRN